MTTTLPTSTNLAAKNLLAKLMATEDITVEHSASAQTASFNMETRVLTLPVWKDLDTDTLDMLIGHEVSHALHTPAGRDPLANACKVVDAKNQMVAKDYLNVVEDARIERMIKARFPGLKRSFATGYRDLMKRDLFGLKKIGDVSTLPLIDRINLQYKIGWLMEVPFNDSELALVQRVATTVTWDDVVSLTKEIYDFAKEQAKNDKKDEKGDEGSDKGKKDDSESEETDGEGSVPSGEDGEDDGDSDGSKGMDNDDDDADSEDDSDGGKGEDTDEEANSESKSSEGDESEDNESEDGTEGGDNSRPSDESDDAKEADSNKSESDKETKATSEESKVSESDRPAPTSVTARNAEDAMKGLVDVDAKTTYYVNLPDVDKGFVVSMKTVRESLIKWADKQDNRKAAAAAIYASWKTQNAGAVQVLATEFDRRKAADAHKRTAVAETGSIDPNRLHAYRIAEDIFLQNAYVKDGKNHGLVLLLDMSGSMAGVFHDTMHQLVTLAHFCRRVSIPFSFYGYTDRAGAYSADPSFKAGSFSATDIKTRLVTLLQDGMKVNEFTETCGLLLLSAYDSGTSLRGDHPTLAALAPLNYAKGWGGVDWMTLDNTPTNAALLGLPSVMEEFKRVKRVEIMNLIVLTDGEASDDMIHPARYSDAYKSKVGVDSYGYTKSGMIVWRDMKRRKEYAATKSYSHNRVCDLRRDEQSALLLAIIRDRVGGKSVCIHLIDRREGHTLTQGSNLIESSMVNPTCQQANALREKVAKDWKNNDWVSIPNARGFNDYIVVRNDTSDKTISTGDVDLTDKNAIRDLRKAFTKSMAQTRANRPLLARVAELISK